MDEMPDWSPCRFEADGSARAPNIHDHFVYALTVHLDRRQLVLHTQYRDGRGPYEMVDLRFVGHIAHHFDDVAGPSILLDIQAVGAGWIVEHWGELFDRRKNYGWPPVEHSDRPDLASRLESRSVRGYLVMGSCGLDGFVLASSAEYRPRPDAAGLA